MIKILKETCHQDYENFLTVYVVHTNVGDFKGFAKPHGGDDFDSLRGEEIARIKAHIKLHKHAFRENVELYDYLNRLKVELGQDSQKRTYAIKSLSERLERFK